MESLQLGAVIDALRDAGVIFSKGLTPDEIKDIESRHSIQFPPDLKIFLQNALPTGPRFPNWRHASDGHIQDTLNWPLEGMCFDIEHNSFWHTEWGSKPAGLREAFAIAHRAVSAAPRLIPIYGHRYIPDRPNQAGNPIFSVYQTDIIYYGHDLLSYFKNEFKIKIASTDPMNPRPIEFWSDLVS